MPGALESQGETAGSLQGGLGEGSKAAASAWQQALPACLPGPRSAPLGCARCALRRPQAHLPFASVSKVLPAILSVPTHSTLSQTAHLFLALGPFPEAYIFLFVPNFVSLTSFTPLGCVCLDAHHVHAAPPLVVPHT